MYLVCTFARWQSRQHRKFILNVATTFQVTTILRCCELLCPCPAALPCTYIRVIPPARPIQLCHLHIPGPTDTAPPRKFAAAAQAAQIALATRVPSASYR